MNLDLCAVIGRPSVIYTDTGEEPVLSARKMIDQLVQAGKTATLVFEHCPPDLHAGLASRISSSENRIKLITVDYGIRDPSAPGLVWRQILGSWVVDAGPMGATAVAVMLAMPRLSAV